MSVCLYVLSLFISKNQIEFVRLRIKDIYASITRAPENNQNYK